MNGKIGKLPEVLVASLLLATGYASNASAQAYTGRIDVTIVDSTGGRVPGATVQLTGPALQSVASDSQGQAHFLSLPVGIYSLTVSLQGFNTYTNNEVQVATLAATAVPVKLGVAGTTENVEVTAATPIVDVKRQTTTTNVTYDELQNIPTARDPWVIMQTVPSITVDRINVGGANSDSQSVFMGKGNQILDNTFNIDGVPVTDMSSTGSSGFYYDFDSFKEMSVTTGGADASVFTPGVQLNMVLKSGTNAYHGDARVIFDNAGLQANNLSPALAASLGSPNGFGNRTNRYVDDGFDAGGPVIKDKLFAWGTLARTNIRTFNLKNTPSETTFKNYALKTDFDPSPSARFNFTFYEDNKIKTGRNVGGLASIILGPATENQNGPTKYYKGESNLVLGRRLYVTARYAYTDAGFTFVPQGGQSNIIVDTAGEQIGSNFYLATSRPQYYSSANASYFAGKHELKFGFAWRRTPISSSTVWPGNHIVTTQLPGFPASSAIASDGTPCGGCNASVLINADTFTGQVGQYANLFVTDTISLNRLTINAGLRYDHQTSSLTPSTLSAVTGFSSYLPAVASPAVSNVWAFNTVDPRVGFGYALDDSRKTIARVNYSMFASQLPAGAANFVSNTVSASCNGFANVQNSSGAAGPSDVNLSPAAGFSCFAPGTGVAATNGFTVNATAPRTHEIQVGVDRELMPNVGVSATVTWRRFTNLVWDVPDGITSADFVQTKTLTGTLPTGQTYSVPYYSLTPAASARWNQLWTATNRPGYYQRYLGLELSATKRLANHWMARIGFGSSSFTEHFSNRAQSIIDPTPTYFSSLTGLQWQVPSPNAGTQYTYGNGPGVDGGSMVVYDNGSGENNVWILPVHYQVTANGLYQGPWGLNFAANLLVRQGFGQPYYMPVSTGDLGQGQKNVLLASDVNSNRLPTVKAFDTRVSKTFAMGQYKVAIDLDAFNLFNTSTVLANQFNAKTSTFGQPLEIINPRIARIGLRFMF
jgi:carboxypeptidase family protein